MENQVEFIRRDWYEEPLTKDELLRYIRWRRNQPTESGRPLTNIDIGREVAMTANWVSDFDLGRVKSLPRTRAIAVSRLLAGIWPHGIPVPALEVKQAETLQEDLERAFGSEQARGHVSIDSLNGVQVLTYTDLLGESAIFVSRDQYDAAMQTIRTLSLKVEELQHDNRALQEEQNRRVAQVKTLQDEVLHLSQYRGVLVGLARTLRDLSLVLNEQDREDEDLDASVYTRERQ